MVVPDPASDAASSGLYLDPETFPASVAGVARAHNRAAAALSQLIKSVPGNSDMFGDAGVQSTCSTFHDAWQGETDVAAAALAEAAWLLTTAVRDLVNADIQGGADIAKTLPLDLPPIVPPQDNPPSNKKEETLDDPPSQKKEETHDKKPAYR
ncbi:hypothetical protein ACLMAL_23675 [Nocardia sp. CWNU-33]|uniref:hypothetical protein n=1 Tax=Nocardia sp. CWNU-33 TaxID=3392117 RepID=UPI00398F7AD9